ncbi:MAG: extracellular solute-binding protein [Acidimicrobiales bacterium]
MITKLRKSLGAGTLALAMLVPLLAGCGANASSAGGGITLYNGQHEQTTDALVAGFEKATGIRVKVANNDENTFDDQIIAQGPNSPADVIYTENSPALEDLQAKGLLAPVEAATLAATPSKYDSPQGDWVGVSSRVSVMVYDPSLISKADLPTSVLQLADPKYKGKLAIAPGETDFQPIVTSVIRTYGEAAALKWLQGLKTNAGPRQYPDNETITSNVNKGRAAIGIIDQYYWYRLRAQLGASNMHSAIAYFAGGDPGYVIDVSGAAVLASSRHKAEAQRFLAYLVSKPGQEIIARSDSFEYPIASGVTTAQPETPFGDLRPNPIDLAQLGTGATAVALLGEAQLL